MELVVVGRRCGMPAQESPSSGYLVRTASAHVLLDCGPGVTGPLRGHLGDRQLDAVAISHLHVDHCYDLLPLGRALLASGPHAPTASRPVALWLPPGGVRRMQSLGALFPIADDGPAHPLDQVFDLAFRSSEYRPSTALTVGGARVTPFATRHRIASCGFRVDADGATLAYTGDTGPTAELLPLARGADLLLCEATLREPDTTGHGHLTASEAGQLAARAGVRRLVLTHIADPDPAWVDALVADARSWYGGPVEVAAPGSTFTLPTRPSRKD